MSGSEELYQKAYKIHYEQGNHEEAIKMYSQVIVQYPSSSEANYAKTQIKNIDTGLTTVKPIRLEPYLKVILTTAHGLEGYRIIETIDVISAECALGMDLISDFLTSVSDVFGGRSGTTQSFLRDARKTCLREMRMEAYEMGANAVIGVNLAYSEFSGKGKSSLFVVATGTAVKVENIQSELME